MVVTKKYFGLGFSAAAMFTLLAFLVQRGATLAFDNSIVNNLYNHRTDIADSVLQFITFFGRPEILFPIGALLFSGLLLHKRRFAALIVATMFAGTGVLTSILKEVFDRVRPQQLFQSAYESSFSFPSGHASTSMIISLVVISLLWRYKQWRVVTISLALTYILIIGISRPYLSVHYPTDILAGWLVALFWFGLVNGFYYLYLYRYRRYDGERL